MAHWGSGGGGLGTGAVAARPPPHVCSGGLCRSGMVRSWSAGWRPPQRVRCQHDAGSRRGCAGIKLPSRRHWTCPEVLVKSTSNRGVRPPGVGGVRGAVPGRVPAPSVGGAKRDTVPAGVARPNQAVIALERRATGLLSLPG